MLKLQSELAMMFNSLRVLFYDTSHWYTVLCVLCVLDCCWMTSTTHVEFFKGHRTIAHLHILWNCTWRTNTGLQVRFQA